MKRKVICGLLIVFSVTFGFVLFSPSGKGYVSKLFFHENADDTITTETEMDKPVEILDYLPDGREIGDVFLGAYGYERVIAIGEDGSYLTEEVRDWDGT